MSALNVTLIQIVRLAFLETVEGLAFRARKGFSSIR